MLEEKSTQPWWLNLKAGSYLNETEKAVLDEVLSGLYGYHLVQIGPPKFASMVSSTLISHRVLINPQGNSNWPCSLIRGESENLALLHDSVDVVVLTHTLELASQPHQVLREAHRCLIPEGHIVITGINPFSLWGVWTLIKRLFSKQSSNKLISPHRVKDWLKLLDFDVRKSEMFFYRPPLSSKTMMNRLTFLESVGKRFWPILGGAYVIVGVKKIVGITPIKPKFAKKKTAWSPQEVAGSANYKRDKS